MPWKRLLTLILLGAALWYQPGSLCAQGFLDSDTASLFQIKASLEEEESAVFLNVAFQIAPNHYMYGDMITVEAAPPVRLEPDTLPSGEMQMDTLSGLNELREVFTGSFVQRYRLAGPLPDAVEVKVGFQGCSETICFMPEEREFVLSTDVLTRTDRAAASGESDLADDAAPAVEPSPTPASDVDEGQEWQPQIASFTVAASRAGYYSAADFKPFLEQGLQGPDAFATAQGSWLAQRIENLQQQGLWLRIIIILLGGLLLNLTPCVLPMIPINLAIIGAGSQAASRSRGFLLGGAYGLGIALTYGVLGLVVVFGLSTFGAFSASPWFNLGIAILFVVLALAMFDVFEIDFSRLGAKVAPDGKKRGGFALPFAIGCVSALLAGACVAPVVIAVLVMSSNLYAAGQTGALALPFLLGLGMALPWPVAGTGLSMLPKPGAWMAWVKKGFGVFILLFALYYGAMAWSLYQSAAPQDAAPTTLDAAEATDGAEPVAPAGIVDPDHDAIAWIKSLPEALDRAHETGKPVFIDFWATWCKNCLVMDATTFQDTEIQSLLEGYVALKYQAERPREAATKAVLDHFGVIGLPTYVILYPPTFEPEGANGNDGAE